MHTSLLNTKHGALHEAVECGEISEQKLRDFLDIFNLFFLRCPEETPRVCYPDFF